MPARPNILWYCTDQQRYDTIAALGNQYVRTPTIDSLVHQGVAFTHAYCQSPICTPSRSSFMTGMYPTRLHNTRNGNDSFPSYPPVVSKVLADSGYDCGLVGKFHLQSSGRRTEPRIDDGYSFWKFSHAPRDDWPDGHHYADWVKEKGGDLNALRESPERVPPEFHQTTWASDMSIEFIESKRPSDQPWMLSVNIYDPHPPFIPPKVYADRYDASQMPGPLFRESDLVHQAKLRSIDFQDEIRTPEEHDAKQKQAWYYAMIEQIDDQLARVIDSLERSGQRDNTVIIFMSDHGESLGDHGLMYKGCRFYDGLVRVPLIFSWPGRFKEGVQSSGLVELMDVTASLIDLAGLEQPEYMQGRTLLPLTRGDVSADHFRAFVRSEYFDALDPLFVGTETDDGAAPAGTYATMYRDEQYKLSVYHNKNLGELYDLKADPGEFNDLWDSPDHQQLKSELIYKSFNAHVKMTTDVGSPRNAPM